MIIINIIYSAFLYTGADVDKQDVVGIAPLHGACDQGYIDIVKELLSAKASVELKTIDNTNPLYFAAKTGQRDMIELLLANGAKVRHVATITFINKCKFHSGNTCLSSHR